MSASRTGLYRFELLPSADPEAFERHMQSVVFKSMNILQLTRVTGGFDHQLLQGPRQQYVWLTGANLVNDADVYDFDQNAERIREAVKEFAVLTDIESFTNLNFRSV